MSGPSSSGVRSLLVDSRRNCSATSCSLKPTQSIASKPILISPKCQPETKFVLPARPRIHTHRSWLARNAYNVDNKYDRKCNSKHTIARQFCWVILYLDLASIEEWTGSRWTQLFLLVVFVRSHSQFGYFTRQYLLLYVRCLLKVRTRGEKKAHWYSNPWTPFLLWQEAENKWAGVPSCFSSKAKLGTQSLNRNVQNFFTFLRMVSVPWNCLGVFNLVIAPVVWDAILSFLGQAICSRHSILLVKCTHFLNFSATPVLRKSVKILRMCLESSCWDPEKISKLS